MRKVPGLETVVRDYASKGVNFYYVYKALAHPETNGYVTPFSLEERLLHVKEAERRLGSRVTWICDTMDNEIKHAFGDAPNSEFILDADGRIIRKRVWSNPEQVRRDLETLIGPVEHPTSIADLDLKTIPPPRVAARGVVPPVRVPGRMRPVRIEPEIKENGQPFYVKLRAEVDDQLARTGRGTMYLGFHLDPIYGVHWNNLAKPVEFSIEAPEGITVAPAAGTGPKVSVPSDIDPREFLVDVTSTSRDKPLKLTVRYFACNDDEGWCKAVTQQYAIRLDLDPDGGWNMQRFRARSSSRQRRPAAGAPGRNAAGERFRGQVVKVDKKSRLLTLRGRDGNEHQFRVADGLSFMRDGKRSGIEDLQSLDRVQVAVDRSGDAKVPVIRRMMARSP